MKSVKSGLDEQSTPTRGRTSAGEGGAREETVSKESTIVSRPEERNSMSPEREERIRLRAYMRAKERGFAGGDEVVDWLEAEREIAAEEREAGGERESGVIR